jgi:sulfopropanediol 3-dehydrogenase
MYVFNFIPWTYCLAFGAFVVCELKADVGAGASAGRSGSLAPHETLGALPARRKETGLGETNEGERLESPLYLKRPREEPVKGSPPEVRERVSEMLSRIEGEGMDAVRAYSRELDGWDPPDFRVSEEEIERAAGSVEPELRESIEFGRDNTRRFAEMQRETLVDFEEEVAPGVVAGQRQVPVRSVGAYQPAGRVPLLASPFMTVAVPKVAGVGRVIACVPPRREGGVHPAMLYSIDVSGADAIYAVGGVQALAAMAFGLFEDLDRPVDMIVGAGNAYVAEAKRQLFGVVGIDLLAGPSEVAVIADDSADPELVTADLLGQAEHGPTSPASLVTTSQELGRAVMEEIDHQLGELETADVAGSAWRDHGTVVVAGSREEAARLSDELAPEHLEVHAEEEDWYLENLKNYGSLFLGDRSTVAYSDKGMTGTNHVLPTAGAARYTGGLSVAKFTKTLTYQRVVSDEGTRRLAPPVVRFSRTEGLWAHEATARKRLERLSDERVDRYDA